MSSRPLHNYLRMYRKRSNLTQEELAVLLGCRYGSKVSRYERGARCPSLETLLAYQVIFEASGRDCFKGVYRDVEAAVRKRARKLYRELDELDDFDASTKRKMDLIAEIIYPQIKEKHED